MPKRNDTGHLNHLRVEAANELGFNSFHELASLSRINPGTLCGIYTGQRRSISSSEADLLIYTVHMRNLDRGWNYRHSAFQLVEVLNCVRNHYAHASGKTVPKISEATVRQWVIAHMERLAAAQEDFDDPLNIISLQSSTKDVLDCLLEFAKNWEMKHDFHYLDKVRRKFEQNFSILIRPKILHGMQEGGFYEEIRDVYTEMRYIAHLCEEYQFVQEMSNWLIEQSRIQGDIQTEIKARVMLAWTLTTQKTKSTLQNAKYQLEVIWNTMKEDEFLDSLPATDIDVAALFAELHLRWPIRMSEVGLLSLQGIDFDQRFLESKQLIDRAMRGKDLPSRLKSRYTIPLSYQRGVYFYCLGKPKKDSSQSLEEACLQLLEQARLQFEEVLTSVDMLGWIRLEQAVYTWLATIYKALDNEENLHRVLDKINVSYLVKRQAIRQEIVDQINGY